MNENEKVYLGLDIAKAKIDCFFQGQYLIVENNLQGYQTLLDELINQSIKLKSLHVCCEATSVYYLGIAKFLYQRKIAISVVNPSMIKSYAKMQLQRVKTDKQDCRLIAEFCSSQKPNLWHPTDKKQQLLQKLNKRIEQLNNILTQEKNRLHLEKMTNSAIVKSIDKIISFVEQEIEHCKKKIDKIISTDAELKQKQKILMTISGVGKDTANILISMLDVNKFKTAKQVISYFGLSPIIRNSGNFRGRQQVSKMGNRYMRKSLYMPARSACTISKFWRGWFDYQLKKGKHPKQIYVLMMVKILKYAYVCLKNNQLFNKELHNDRLQNLK